MHKSNKSRMRKQYNIVVKVLNRCKVIKKVMWRHIVDMKKKRKKNSENAEDF